MTPSISPTDRPVVDLVRQGTAVGVGTVDIVENLPDLGLPEE